MANTPTTDEPPAVLGYADGKPPRSRRTDRVTITVMFVVALVLVGTILAVSRPCTRASTRRSVADPGLCAANLRQIGIACRMYGRQDLRNEGNFPPSAGLLLGNSDLPEGRFNCPNSTAVPAGGRTLREKAAALDSSTPPGSPGCCLSYVYVGGGLHVDESPASAVVAYEPSVNHNGEGGHVLFVDGTVVWYGTPQLTSIIAAVQAGQNPPPPATTQPTKP